MPAIAAVVAVVASVGAGTAAAVGVTVAASGVAAAVIGGAVIGAVVGGVTAAVKGGDILQGALKGGLIGGALGGVGAWAAPAAAEAGVAAQATGMSLGETAAAGWQGTTAAEITAGTSLGETSSIGLAGGPTVAGKGVGTVGKTVAEETVKKGALSTGEKMIMLGSVAQGAGSMMASEDPGQLAKEEAERNSLKLQPDVVLPQMNLRINQAPGVARNVTPTVTQETLAPEKVAAPAPVQQQTQGMIAPAPTRKTIQPVTNYRKTGML